MKPVAKMFLKLLKRNNIGRKTITQYKEEILLRQGKEQFRKLVKNGLRVPVVLM